MITEVFLDTNTYLRLAKRIRPAVGRQFGQVPYVLVILKIVEDEVHQSPKLQYKNPWFDEPEFAKERLSKQLRLNAVDKNAIQLVQGVLLGIVQQDIEKYITHRRSPPGRTDCWLLAYAQVKHAIVATDDLGIHTLAGETGLKVWHGYELLAKLRSAKVVDNEKIREIYEALEANNDLTDTWRKARLDQFSKIFGPKP